jgi:Zn-dependent M28 family amino/carboxypeptidase
MNHIACLAVLSLLQAVAPAAPDALADDVRRLSASPTNEARFEVLTGMLRERNLSFAVGSFMLEEPLRGEARTEGRNVIVTIGDGAETIVVGAHYDAVRLPDGSLSHGAVDNGASTVMLVRLADALRTEMLPVRVKVVWFDMEELGLIGSARFIESHASERIAAMINFDINAYGDTILFGPSAGPDTAGLRRSLRETCAAVSIECVGFPQMPPGDDRSFTSRGIPAVSVAMLPAVEAHQLWLLMNAGPDAGLAPGTTPAIMQTIHTANDTVGKVDGASMTRSLEFALALVRKVAMSPDTRGARQ